MSERTWFQSLLDDNGVVELRVSDGYSWDSGYYDDLELLLRDIAHHSELGCDVYSSLNSPSHYRVTNHIHPSTKALRDADIEKYSRLLIDLDPVRSNSPSSEDELDKAREAARKIHALMQGYDFPEPAWACSGNGIHLIYRVEIPEASKFHPQWKQTLKGLKNIMQLKDVELDTSVANPAQICRAYGTINLKGGEAAQRPFRRSEVWIPSRYRCVPRSALTALSEVCIQSITVHSTGHSISPNRVTRDASKPHGKGDYKTLDAVGWFKWLGLYAFSCNENKHAVICPWSAEHTGGGKQDAATSTVLFTDSDYPVFHCKHNSCEDRRLFDVIDSLEGADEFCARDWGANT
jgi:hypothetical protein